MGKDPSAPPVLDSPAKPITITSLIPSAFLPAMIFEIGNGAMAPILALTALHLGASPKTAGFTLSLLGIGQILGDVPAAALANRVGDRRAMVIAATLALVAQLSCVVAPTVALLDVALLVIGMSTAVFYLARQAYLTEVVSVGIRARAMSTLGGSHRIGLFAGPFIGAAAIHFVGLHGAYLVAVAASALTGLVLVIVPDLPGARAAAPAAASRGVGVRQMVTDHRRLFATLGLAVVTVGAVRAARQTVLPLWAEHLGLSAEQTSLIFGIASAVDMSLFYPSGKVMDRQGRLFIAVPAMLIMGASMMALPLAHGAVMLTVLAMLMSVGNGIGSGIMMTLGADVAPAEGRLPFLSVWRVMSDVGNAAGPVVVSVVATLSSLAAGIVTIGALGPLASAGLTWWVPRYSTFATRRMVRAHRARSASPSQRHGPSQPYGPSRRHGPSEPHDKSQEVPPHEVPHGSNQA
jgi:MFS family permease